MLRKLLLKVIPNPDKQPLEHDLLYNRSTGELLIQSYVNTSLYMVLYDMKNGQPVKFASDATIKPATITNKDDYCFVEGYRENELPNMFEVCEKHFDNSRFFKKNDLITIDHDYVIALQQKVKRLYPDASVSTIGRVHDYKLLVIEVRQNGNPVVELNVISTKKTARKEIIEEVITIHFEIKREWIYSHIPAVIYNKKIIYVTPEQYANSQDDCNGVWTDEQ